MCKIAPYLLLILCLIFDILIKVKMCFPNFWFEFWENKNEIQGKNAT